MVPLVAPSGVAMEGLALTTRRLTAAEEFKPEGIRTVISGLVPPNRTLLDLGENAAPPSVSMMRLSQTVLEVSLFARA